MSGFGYATVEEIMSIYKVSRKYVYKMANAHQWGRYRHPDGGTRYRREHVDKTLAEGATRRQRIREGKVQP